MSKEVNWQEECLKKGFEYVREPDDHYVIADPSEMVALLRDLLGVDVRTKDCDSYGVAVCELQEQIDGLVNTIHAQQAERDTLLAERDRLSNDLADARMLFVRDTDELIAERDALEKALDRQVPLHDAIQRAAGELPNGWEIRLFVEREAGWVELYDPAGNEIEDFATDAERLDYTVIDALEHALQGEQP